MEDSTRVLEQPVGAGDLERKTTADKIHLLFEQSFPAVFISLVNASLLLVALWPDVSHSKLLIWYAAILIASSIRAVLFLTFRIRSPIEVAVLAWERPYFVSLIFSALVWGVGGLWLIVSAVASAQLII